MPKPRAALLPLALFPLFAAACGSSAPKAASTPAPTPSIAAQTAEQKVLNYQACSKDGKQKLSTVLPKAANAPDLKIEQTHVVGELPGMVRVGIIYDYNAGSAKHQVIFDYNPDKNTLAGEDTISQNAIKQLQSACK